MSHILITSGPTRQYLDPVRFLSNASSGRMGAALADAVLAASIFHFAEYSIHEAKQHMADRGIEMRL